jgi:hypothetical protein
MAVWAALAAAVIAVEVVALVADDRFPTLGDLLDLLLRPRLGRWVILLGWLWLGWHLLVRYRQG